MIQRGTRVRAQLSISYLRSVADNFWSAGALIQVLPGMVAGDAYRLAFGSAASSLRNLLAADGYNPTVGQSYTSVTVDATLPVDFGNLNDVLGAIAQYAQRAGFTIDGSSSYIQVIGAVPPGQAALVDPLAAQQGGSVLTNLFGGAVNSAAGAAGAQIPWALVIGGIVLVIALRR
jgi:hypothetical protein